MKAGTGQWVIKFDSTRTFEQLTGEIGTPEERLGEHATTKTFTVEELRRYWDVTTDPITGTTTSLGYPTENAAMLMWQHMLKTADLTNDTVAPPIIYATDTVYTSTDTTLERTGLDAALAKAKAAVSDGKFQPIFINHTQPVPHFTLLGIKKEGDKVVIRHLDPLRTNANIRKRSIAPLIKQLETTFPEAKVTMEVTTQQVGNNCAGHMVINAIALAKHGINFNFRTSQADAQEVSLQHQHASDARHYLNLFARDCLQPAQQARLGDSTNLSEYTVVQQDQNNQRVLSALSGASHTSSVEDAQRLAHLLVVDKAILPTNEASLANALATLLTSSERQTEFTNNSALLSRLAINMESYPALAERVAERLHLLVPENQAKIATNNGKSNPNGMYGGIGAEVVPAYGEDGTVKGFRVLSVFKDSPAAKAGLKAGDIITSVGDKQITGEDAATLFHDKPGRDVTFGIEQLDGTTKSITVTRDLVNSKYRSKHDFAREAAIKDGIKDALPKLTHKIPTKENAARNYQNLQKEKRIDGTTVYKVNGQELSKDDADAVRQIRKELKQLAHGFVAEEETKAGNTLTSEAIATKMQSGFVQRISSHNTNGGPHRKA